MTKKTEIIKVNATIDDDINIVIDTIRKANGTNILLVLPEGNDLINSPVGLKTLKRKALSLGKNLVLVAPNKKYAQLASDAGNIVVTNQDEVTSDMWEKGRQELDELHQSQVGLNSKKDEKEEKEAEKAETLDAKPEVIMGGHIVDASHDVNDDNEQTHSATQNSEKATENIDENSIIAEKVQMRGAMKKNDEEKLPAGHGIIGMDVSKVVSKSQPGPFASLFKKKSPPVQTASDNDGYELLKPAKPVGNSKAWLRVTGIFIAGMLLLVGGVFVAYYLFFPRLRIELKVVSDKVDVNETVVATTAVTGFDINKKEFQLIKERAEQRGSVNINATGDGIDGTKATGTMTIGGNPGPGSVTVPAGTTVTSTSGLKFITQAEITVPASPLSTTVGVVAADFGEEYNVTPSSGYTVSGFATLSAANASAFTGGTKRTFKVLSKKDVDDAVDQLKKDLFDQLKSDLQYRNQNNGYVFIEESFKSDIEGTPVVNPAVGTETTQAFLEMKTTATAYYYHRESYEKLSERFLGDKYKLNKSINSEVDLLIDQRVLKTEKITVGTDDKATFVMSASALVTPRLNTEQLRTDIAGKKWPEMLATVSAIDTLATTPNITFYPQWMPDFLRYVPQEESRVDISVTVTQQN
jgi:hypothetical protein